MFEFFDQVLGYLQFLFDYFYGVVSAFLEASLVLIAITQIPNTLTGFLPGALAASVVITTAILILRFLALK